MGVSGATSSGLVGTMPDRCTPENDAAFCGIADLRETRDRREQHQRHDHRDGCGPDDRDQTCHYAITLVICGTRNQAGSGATHYLPTGQRRRRRAAGPRRCTFLSEQGPDARRRAREQLARRRLLRFGAAGGDCLPQSRGHRPAARAAVEVPFDRPPASGRQSRRPDSATAPATVHGSARTGGLRRVISDALPVAPQCAWSWSRARCRRVLTLSSEMPITFATSRVDRPSISRRNTMARYGPGNVRKRLSQATTEPGVVRQLLRILPGIAASSGRAAPSWPGSTSSSDCSRAARRPSSAAPSDRRCARCDTATAGRPPARGSVRRSDTS